MNLFNRTFSMKAIGFLSCLAMSWSISVYAGSDQGVKTTNTGNSNTKVEIITTKTEGRKKPCCDKKSQSDAAASTTPTPQAPNTKSCCKKKKSEEALAKTVAPSPKSADTKSCCSKKDQKVALTSTGKTDLAVKETTPTTKPDRLRLNIADEELLDQDGHSVRFYTDLVKGKSVAIANFFTSCTTVCPTLTATMAGVQNMLLENGRDDIQLIFISVDPVTDTPKRLKAWSHNFGAKPGWTFVTGKKPAIDHVLKSLKSFTAAPEDHSPMILIGHEPTGNWKQVYGLSSATDLYEAIIKYAGPKPIVAKEDRTSADEVTEASKPHASGLDAEALARADEAGLKYFTDVELVDQHGEPHRLYTDLMQGKIVLVNSFFSTCKGVCPVMAQKLHTIAKAYPDRMGKDFFFLSVSVDPLVDTPPKLGDYAKSVRAMEGWLFLSGKKENVELALSKFGMAVESRENHSNLFVLGNLKTGLWKKAFGLANPDDLLPVVDSVVNDKNDSTY